MQKKGEPAISEAPVYTDNIYQTNVPTELAAKLA